MNHSKKSALSRFPLLRRKLLTFSGIAIAASALVFSEVLMAGNTWTGGGSGLFNWSDPANWGGSLPGHGTLIFSGTAGTTNTLDGVFTAGGNTNMNQVNWNGASAWVMNSTNGAILNLFDDGGTQAKLESLGLGGVTINAPITFAATTGNNWGEINAVGSDFTFGASGTLTVNGSAVNGIRMFAGSGKTTTFNNTVSASDKYFATVGANQIVNIGGAFTSGNFFLMNGSTLRLNTGGTLTTSGAGFPALRLGGDFGTTGSQNLSAGATFQLTPLTGGLTTNALINTVSGNTSGNLLIDSLNTSGTNTLAGDFYLDSDLKVQQATGGTLVISDATTDLKNQTLTVAGSGTVNLTGVVGNSVGSGKITLTSGTLNLLNNGNTYSGVTTISGGRLILASNVSFGTGGIGTGAIVLQGGTLGHTYAATNTLEYRVANPISVAAGQTGTIETPNRFRLNAAVSGAGTLNMVIGTGTSRADLQNSFNSFTGTLNITGSGNIRVGYTTLGSAQPLAPTNSFANATLSLDGATFLPVLGNTSATIFIGGLSSTAASGVLGQASLLDATAGGGAATYSIGGNNVSTAFGGTIVGDSLLIKTGTGTLTLSGANTHTGAITISGGALQVGNAGSTGTLGSGPVANNATLIYNRTDAFTVPNAMTGTGVLAMDGSGTLTLNGSVAAGSLFARNTGKLVIDTGGAVTTSAFSSIGTFSGDNASVTLKGSGAWTSNGDLNVADPASGVNASGTLNIEGSSALNIGTNGGLYVGSAFFAGTQVATGTVNQSGGTVIHNNPAAGAFVIGGRNGASAVGNYNTSAGTTTAKGQVYVGGAGSGTLTLSGTGLFDAQAGLLLGNNSNGSASSTGTVNLNGGILKTTTVTKGGGSGTFNFDGGTLQARASSATFMTGLTTANVKNGGAIIDSNGFDITIGQQLVNFAGTASGFLTKNGAGTLTLSNANTYSGGTTVNSGTLSLLNSSGAGTGGITLKNATVLNLGNSSSVFPSVAVQISGANANASLTASHASAGFGSAITASSDQTVTIAGTTQVNFNGSNTKQFQGVTGPVEVLNGATLRFSSSTSLANGGDNALFNVVGHLTTRNNGSVSLGALNGSGSIAMGTSGVNNAGATYIIGARATNATFSGAIFDGDTATGKIVSISKTGSATQTFSGSNSYTGTTTIDAGTLNAAATGALGQAATGTSGVTVNNGGTLLLSNTAATDRVNNTASLALNSGGKLSLGQTADTVSTSESLGALTLTANSTIDFASTSSGSGFVAIFSSLAALPTGSDYVTILNWNGLRNTLGTSGTNDRLIFTDNALGFVEGSISNNILFDIEGTLYNTKFLTAGSLEAVAFEPIPEPSVFFGALGLLGLAFHRETGRKRRE